MLRLSDHVRTTHNADGAVLLDIHAGQIFALNPTGSRIVELLKVGADEKEIAPILSREYSIDLERAEADTTAFLMRLHQHGLLEPYA